MFKLFPFAETNNYTPQSRLLLVVYIVLQQTISLQALQVKIPVTAHYYR